MKSRVYQLSGDFTASNITLRNQMRTRKVENCPAGPPDQMLLFASQIRSLLPPLEFSPPTQRKNLEALREPLKGLRGLTDREVSKSIIGMPSLWLLRAAKLQDTPPPQSLELFLFSGSKERSEVSEKQSPPLAI